MPKAWVLSTTVCSAWADMAIRQKMKIDSSDLNFIVFSPIDF
jgi:hypothetical protein